MGLPDIPRKCRCLSYLFVFSLCLQSFHCLLDAFGKVPNTKYKIPLQHGQPDTDRLPPAPDWLKWLTRPAPPKVKMTPPRPLTIIRPQPLW